MDPGIDPLVGILFAVVALFFVGLLLTALIMKIHDFNHKLDYINLEIRRTTGKQRKYWKRERHRLWLSLLPFFHK